MNDDPHQFADQLVEQYGLDGALQKVHEGIAAAHAAGDNYSLSIWREVRPILLGKRDGPDK